MFETVMLRVHSKPAGIDPLPRHVCLCAHLGAWTDTADRHSAVAQVGIQSVLDAELTGCPPCVQLACAVKFSFLGGAGSRLRVFLPHLLSTHLLGEGKAA